MKSIELNLKDAQFDKKIFFGTPRLIADDGISQKKGTGLIVRIESERIPNLAWAIVTCKHVLFGIDEIVKFTLHTCGSDRDTPLLGGGLHIEMKLTSANYFEHEDKKIDVAMMDITELMKISNVYAPSLPSSNITEKNLQYISPNREGLFVGYPRDVYDIKNNLPIMRSARIATIPEVDFDGNPCYIIDAHVFPGSSGSPVFASDPHGNIAYVGMIGESFEAWNAVMQSKGSKEPHAGGMGTQEFIGLGVVYKPRVILEVLNKVRDAALARL